MEKGSRNTSLGMEFGSSAESKLLVRLAGLRGYLFKNSCSVSRIDYEKNQRQALIVGRCCRFLEYTTLARMMLSAPSSQLPELDSGLDVSDELYQHGPSGPLLFWHDRRSALFALLGPFKQGWETLDNEVPSAPRRSALPLCRPLQGSGVLALP